ncbi:MAG: carbohydrate-binding protein, partial [Rubrivivax sp.]|nr:carbohydrate-binding protein [Rubrivivax sp.]
MAHFLTQHEAQDVTVLGLQGQTDRSRWLGRNRAVHEPLAELHELPDEVAGGESMTLDTGLDPVCVLAVRVSIQPQGKAQLTFATAASHDAPTLRALVDKHRQPSHVQRASLMSATLAGIRLRALRISAENFAAVQMLTTALVLGLTRADPQLPGAGFEAQAPGQPSDRRLLWRLGISGDRPLLLVSAGALHGMGLLRTLAQALRLWVWGGIACDLVVVNAEPASYLMALHREIGALRDRHLADTGTSAIGFHLLRADELSAAELDTLQTLARVRLVADGRALQHHVHDWVEGHDQAQAQRAGRSTTPLPSSPQTKSISTGEFAPGSGDFSFLAGATQGPQRPWINVLANPAFGSQVTEAGGGNTWAGNSRLHQITAWSNDPVADPTSEWLML